MRKVSMPTRAELLDALTVRYGLARRAEKARILAEFVALTEYHRTKCRPFLPRQAGARRMCFRRSKTENRPAIGGKAAIGRQKPHPLRGGLDHQQAVEGIAMDRRQRRQPKDMSPFDSQFAVARCQQSRAQHARIGAEVGAL